MSLRKQIIEIQPPEYILGKRSEQFTLTDFVCPHCNGEGGFSYDDYTKKFKKNLDDPDWKACDPCGETGHLQAEITINWSPQSKEK